MTGARLAFRPALSPGTPGMSDSLAGTSGRKLRVDRSKNGNGPLLASPNRAPSAASAELRILHRPLHRKFRGSGVRAALLVARALSRQREVECRFGWFHHENYFPEKSYRSFALLSNGHWYRSSGHVASPRRIGPCCLQRTTDALQDCPLGGRLTFPAGFLRPSAAAARTVLRGWGVSVPRQQQARAPPTPQRHICAIGLAP
jgi:hypothetical protein